MREKRASAFQRTVVIVVVHGAELPDKLGGLSSSRRVAAHREGEDSPQRRENQFIISVYLPQLQKTRKGHIFG